MSINAGAKGPCLRNTDMNEYNSCQTTAIMSPCFTISVEVVDARRTIDEQVEATADTSFGESEDECGEVVRRLHNRYYNEREKEGG